MSPTPTQKNVKNKIKTRYKTSIFQCLESNIIFLCSCPRSKEDGQRKFSKENKWMMQQFWTLLANSNKKNVLYCKKKIHHCILKTKIGQKSKGELGNPWTCVNAYQKCSFRWFVTYSTLPYSTLHLCKTVYKFWNHAINIHFLSEVKNILTAFKIIMYCIK